MLPPSIWLDKNCLPYKLTKMLFPIKENIRQMKILLINGPNMNRMHKRVPAFDDSGTTLDDIIQSIQQYAASLGFGLDAFQSNHEGDIVDKLQESPVNYCGIIINPGPLAQYSPAIRATLASLPIPSAEVHLINIFKSGEDSICAKGANCVIMGLGKKSYLLAVDAISHALAS